MSVGTIRWSVIEQHCHERIKILHEQLERAPLESIAKLQGAIAELRAILGLPEKISPDESRRISD